jgi:UPF0755 protein
MTRSRPNCSAFILISAIVLGLIGLGLVFNLVSAIPKKAEDLFGSASNRLSTSQYYLLAYQLVNEQDLLLNPVNPSGTEIDFSISPDEPLDSILARLKTHELINEIDATRNYLIYTGLDTRIQSGNFKLSPSTPPTDLIASLLDPTPRDVTLVILAGWRMEEIAASLPTTGLSISPEEFTAAANTRFNNLQIVHEIPLGANLEGFFPPGSYSVERALSAEELIRYLLRQYEELLPYEIQNKIELQGLTLYQGVILASIIEREAVLDEEMPIIASVFINRLNIDMKLETDPTVQYAIGYNPAQNTWWTNPLSFADLEVDSPYNTYRYAGLPPAPIANPSLAALQAVAFPAQTPYYYFRAVCDDSGRHNFSQTFEEHLSYACQ